MAGNPTYKLVVDSFYTMFTLRQVQKALGCSRATLYRTLKATEIERYYIPNHPGPKYIWGCSLYKLLTTPIVKKVIKKRRGQEKLPICDAQEIAENLGLPSEYVKQSLTLGWLPTINGKVPWWYEKAVHGLLKLPLASK
ncbi:MAG: hypothetical protein IJ963_00760 [Phascolarctobacterium sp.]|nr:hypothetical protein [Phascolarctobacterium sp.]